MVKGMKAPPLPAKAYDHIPAFSTVPGYHPAYDKLPIPHWGNFAGSGQGFVSGTPTAESIDLQASAFGSGVATSPNYDVVLRYDGSILTAAALGSAEVAVLDNFDFSQIKSIDPRDYTYSPSTVDPDFRPTDTLLVHTSDDRYFAVWSEVVAQQMNGFSLLQSQTLEFII